MRRVWGCIAVGICCVAGSVSAGERQVQETRTTVLAVKGMMCGSCAGAVEQALRRVPGVATVAVDRKTGTAAVTHDANVTPEALREAVRKGGYKAELRPPAAR